MGRLGRLTHFPVDRSRRTCRPQAQRDLARVGHHRLPPTDLLIAACAHAAGGGVLHYDRDFDLILEHTRLSFESVWLAEPGTL